MRTIVTSLATVGLLLGVATVALAASPAFEDVDQNKDGRISQAEARTVEGLDFSKADKNGDGWLSRSEYQAATSGSMQQ